MITFKNESDYLEALKHLEDNNYVEHLHYYTPIENRYTTFKTFRIVFLLPSCSKVETFLKLRFS
jgi:hypothetical protein